MAPVGIYIRPLIVSADRLSGCRSGWYGMHARASQRRQNRTVASMRGGVGGGGETVGPGFVLLAAAPRNHRSPATGESAQAAAIAGQRAALPSPPGTTGSRSGPARREGDTRCAQTRRPLPAVARPLDEQLALIT